MKSLCGLPVLLMVLVVGAGLAQEHPVAGTVTCTYKLSPGPPNLLIDGSAENPRPYPNWEWQGYWVVRPGSLAGERNLQAPLAHTGAGSLKLSNPHKSRAFVCRQMVTAPATGTRWRLRAMACGELEAESSLELACATVVPGLGLWEPQPNIGATTRDALGADWEPLETEFTIPEGAPKLRVVARLQGAGTVYLDDVFLEPADENARKPDALDVLLPLPPACDQQLPVAVKLNIDPPPATCAIESRQAANGNHALSVHLEGVNRETSVAWTTLLVMSADPKSATALSGTIQPLASLPDDVQPWAQYDYVVLPRGDVAAQRYRAIQATRTYAEIATQYKETSDTDYKSGGWLNIARVWRAKAGHGLTSGELAAAIARLRGVPARVVGITHVAFPGIPEPKHPTGRACDVYVPQEGWVRLPEVGVWLNEAIPAAILSILPVTEPEPKYDEWRWEPLRLVGETPLKTDRDSFAWSAQGIGQGQITKAQIVELAQLAAQRWSASVNELTAAGEATVYARLLGRLDTTATADDVRRALSE